MPEQPRGLQPQYEVIRDRPRALAWDDYAEPAHQEWKRLLDAAKNERELQNFLEGNPSFLRSIAGTNGLTVAAAFPHAVIAQPPLRGLDVKIPDFMLVTFDSEVIKPLLIEIEEPSKRWYRNDGNPTAQLTQARHQLAQWRAWFARDANQAWFWQYYAFPDRLRRGRTIEARYLLFYGRRRDLEERPDLNQTRRAMRRDDEVIATLDRLAPDSPASNLITVTKDDRGYRAKVIPPTFELHPADAEWLALVREKEAAAREMRGVSQERREFLGERFLYWDRMAREDRLRVIAGGDGE